MKKLSAIFVLAIFIFSLVPLAIAEEGTSRPAEKAREVVKDARKDVREVKQDTRKDLAANRKETLSTAMMGLKLD